MAYLYILIGIVLGLTISAIVSDKPTDGTLRIDNSDGEGPYLFVELSKNLSDISKKKTVCFDVKTQDFIPR